MKTIRQFIGSFRGLLREKKRIKSYAYIECPDHLRSRLSRIRSNVMLLGMMSLAVLLSTLSYAGIYAGVFGVSKTTHIALSTTYVPTAPIKDGEGSIIRKDTERYFVWYAPGEMRERYGEEESIRDLANIFGLDAVDFGIRFRRCLEDSVNERCPLREKTGERYLLSRSVKREYLQRVMRYGNSIGVEKTGKRAYLVDKYYCHIMGAVESKFKWALRGSLQPLGLTLKTPIQMIIREELGAQRDKYKALAAGALIMDIHSGAIKGMISLPDYSCMEGERGTVNILWDNIYEYGSIAKIFVIYDALKGGLDYNYSLSTADRKEYSDIIDVSHKKYDQSIADALKNSSSRGAAILGYAVIGGEGLMRTFREFGFFSPLVTDFSLNTTYPIDSGNVGKISRKKWLSKNNYKKVTRASFGYSMAYSGIHISRAAAALFNGGRLIEPHIVERKEEQEVKEIGRPEYNLAASLDLLAGLRMNVEIGTGSGIMSDDTVYLCGKTGTAKKSKREERGYARGKFITSFLGVFPCDKPRYIVFVVFDEAQKIGREVPYASIVAAPVAGRIARLSAYFLGVSKPPEISEQFLKRVATIRSYVTKDIQK